MISKIFLAFLCLSIYSLLASNISAQNVNQLSLNGKWKVVWNDGNKGINNLPGFLSFNPLLDTARYVDVDVPMDLNLAMQKKGLFGDINFGTNTLLAGWVARQYWQYYRTFEVSKEAMQKSSWMVFDQLDYNATIFVNGVLAGTHKNAYIPCRIDVTGKLKEGKNLIVVNVESGLWDVADKEGEAYMTDLSTILNKRHWLRKPQYQFAWDWNPNMINVGITGNVQLQWAETARIDQIVSFMSFNNDLSEAELTIRPFVQGLKDKSNITIEATLVETNQKITVQDTLSKTTRPFELKMNVEKPKLWWPAGQGEQSLYTLKISIKENDKIVDSEIRKIGFRKIEIDQPAHPVKGNCFTVKVNNRKVFLKGGNWVPADMIYSSVNKNRLRKLVDMAVDANFNMLRIWGGGHFAGNDLLDLCDEKGLLVWHDFLFACAQYPGDKLEFYNSVKREVTWAVREFAAHPSLFLWAGNNEIEGAVYWWAKTAQKKISPDYVLYHQLFPIIIKNENPSVFYWPSSPYSGKSSEEPGNPYSGDQHPWNVSLGSDGPNFYAYRNYVDRFADEGGFLGASSPATIRQFLPKDQQFVRSVGWDHHDNLVNFWGNSNITYLTTEYWLGTAYTQMSLDDYLFASSLLQAEALTEYISNYHRRKYSSSAAIFWMYNDSWPVTHGWSIVDYYNRKKLSYHPVRRAFSPVTVVVAEDGNQINVYGINDNPLEWKGLLQYGIFNTSGGFVLNESKKVSIPANASTIIASFDKTTYEKAGFTKHGAFAVLKNNDIPVSQYKLLLCKFKEFGFQKPEIKIQQKGDYTIFTSPVFVWGACLDLNGEATVSDNCFDLLPGIPYYIRCKKGDKLNILKTGNSLMIKK